MPSYNKLFLGAPEQLAKLHCLYPYADGPVNQEHMKALSLSDKTGLTQVQGQNKVAWCDIRTARQFQKLEGDDPILDYSQDWGLLVMRVTYQRSGDAFPVYYLPWERNSAVRIKLKPSPKHPTQEKGISIEPSVFITAALQGCSVIVSGDPQAPVVYHLNAEKTTAPPDKTRNEDQQFVADALAKRDDMMRRYGLARSEFPKENPKIGNLRPLDTSTGKGAHLLDYIPGVGPSANKALNQEFLREAEGCVGQFGTVFGIRSNDGNWKFYRQTRTRLYYFGKYPKPDTMQWVDPVCVPFWP